MGVLSTGERDLGFLPEADGRPPRKISSASSAVEASSSESDGERERTGERDFLIFAGLFFVFFLFGCAWIQPELVFFGDFLSASAMISDGRMMTEGRREICSLIYPLNEQIRSVWFYVVMMQDCR